MAERDGETLSLSYGMLYSANASTEATRTTPLYPLPTAVVTHWDTTEPA
jgi:hypothetical protein